MTLWSSGLVRSCDKLKSLYLWYHSTYGHITSQDCNLPWWAPAQKVAWHFDHVVLWNLVTNRNNYISTTTLPMIFKLAKLVTCHEGLLPIFLLHHLVTWSCKIMWETKTIMPPLPQYLWPQNLAGWWLILIDFYT